MKTVKKILIILIAVILIIFGFLAYLGLFNSIDVEEGEIGPFEFIYEDFTGDYAKTAPVFSQIYQDLVADGIKSEKGLGIYYDDPAIVPKDELKSRVGSIVTQEEAMLADKRGNPHKNMTVDRKYVMMAEFPYRNSLSIILGVIKVYPALQKYQEANGYKTATGFEVYDMKNGKITYAMEIIQ